jgi:hypothetical protein
MIDYSGPFLDGIVPVFRPILAMGDEDYVLIQGYPNTDAPPLNYATITVINVEDIGTLEEGEITSFGQAVKQHQDVTIRINTFGKGAYAAAATLASQLGYPSMTDPLSDAGVCYRTKTSVKNITRITQTRHEQRATFDMVLGTADGNFNAEYDETKIGLPSQPVYDSGVVSVDKVTLGVHVIPHGASDVTDIGDLTIE